MDGIKKLLLDGVREEVFSGVAAGIVSGSANEEFEDFYFAGQTSFQPDSSTVDRETIFDLASLTKPLATTLAILCLLNENKLELEQGLKELLGKDVPADKRDIKLAMLLNHTSGLPPHRKYFNSISKHERDGAIPIMRQLVFSEPLDNKPGKNMSYSDLGFILLGWIVEEVCGETLDQFVERKIFSPLGLADDLFFPMAKKTVDPKKVYASCENCSWRRRVLCGEVSDENCFVLGGVAGHAGLFGNIVGVTRLVSHLLGQWQGREKHPSYANKDLRHFFTRQKEVDMGSWALGFDTPSVKGSSGGEKISPTSVGHLGFTGTSFWIDPVRDAAVVLLTNRVHPSRENDKIREFRPRFHDAVWQLLDKEKYRSHSVF